MSMGAALAWFAAALFFSCAIVLLTVGNLSWRRLAPLRKPLRDGRGDAGRSPPAIEGPGRTSRVTFVPGMAGLAALAWAGSGLGFPPARWAAAGGGLLVAVSGFAARVASVHVDACGLTIRYASGRSFELPWDELSMLRSPRWPFGGWSVIGFRGRRTLMPSDLFGQEWAVASIIDRAGLRFARGGWRRSASEAMLSPGA